MKEFLLFVILFFVVHITLKLLSRVMGRLFKESKTGADINFLFTYAAFITVLLIGEGII